MARNAVLNGGEKKVLKFTLATNYGMNAKTGKERVAFVPCVVFGSAEELAAALTENGKGVLVSVDGRVVTSKFESNGQTKYSTEVAVDKNGIRVLAKASAQGPEIEEHVFTGEGQ